MSQSPKLRHGGKVRPLIVRQESQILIPTPFSPIR